MFETLYKIELIKEKPYIAFFMGLFYSIIGISVAAWFFRRDPALVTVGLITVLFYPTIRRLILDETALLKTEKMLAKGHIERHARLIMIYLLIFLGVLIGYSFFSVMLPALATNSIFDDQMSIYTAYSGNAKILDKGTFSMLFSNNITVLILVFATALFIGDGALFILVWNASVWGTVFGALAKASATMGSLNPGILFGIIMTIVLPHVLLEALAYIVAAVSGGVVSRAVLMNKKDWNLVRPLLASAFILFAVSIVILFAGAFVEQYVLVNSKLYQNIIFMSGLIN
jgi:hypothetical protein